MVKLWWVEEVILTYVTQILLLSSERTGLDEQEVTQEEGKKKASTSLPTYMSLTVDAILSFFGGFFHDRLKSLLNGRHQSGLLSLPISPFWKSWTTLRCPDYWSNISA